MGEVRSSSYPVSLLQPGGRSCLTDITMRENPETKLLDRQCINNKNTQTTHIQELIWTHSHFLRQHEPELKRRFGVAKIGIFGSFSRGEERPDSDVDVLVTFQKGRKTFDNFMGTKFYLEDLFRRKVDLVTDAALKPLIRDPILQDVVYA